MSIDDVKTMYEGIIEDTKQKYRLEQIETEGKKFGIDVDRRKTKASIIEEVLAASKKA